MSSGIRGAAIAFGLIVALPGALAQEGIEPALEEQPESGGGQQERDSTGQQDPAPEQERAPNFMPAIQGIESAIRDLIAEEDEIARQRQEEREIADLQAQDDMAFWAMLMFFAALASVFLTGVGVYLIYRTLVYTRETMEEVRKNTAAAVTVANAGLEGNKLNRDMFIMEQRAWIPIRQQDLKVVSPLTWQKRELRLNISIAIQNTGRTPAHQILFDMETTLRRPPRQPADRIARRTRIEAIAHSSSTVFPGETFNTGGDCIWNRKMIEERLANVPNGRPLDDIFVHPSIIGCFDYGVVSKSERRSTIFVVDIIRIKDGDVASMALADCPIPARELVAVVVDVRAD